MLPTILLRRPPRLLRVLLHHLPPCRLASRLVLTSHGPPAESVSLEEFDDPDPSSLGPRQVLVRMLMSPVNPADINVVQGTYPIGPSSLPAVGGGEGVGRVEAAGSEVKRLAQGDWVVPRYNMDGTWTTHLVAPEERLIRVRRDLLTPEMAATLRTNPATAYQILHSFADLRPGDVVLQNGANSAVGRALIQVARSMGLVTVNVVRHRPEVEELKGELKAMGADHVWTEEEHRYKLMDTHTDHLQD